MSDPILTENFAITYVNCERNLAADLYDRDVYLAFHRKQDVPRPLCIVTLWGHYVEWIEVPEEWRRQGIATEVLRGIEQAEGSVLDIEGVTESGEAFVAKYCESQ